MLKASLFSNAIVEIAPNLAPAEYIWNTDTEKPVSKTITQIPPLSSSSACLIITMPVFDALRFSPASAAEPAVGTTTSEYFLEVPTN